MHHIHSTYEPLRGTFLQEARPLLTEREWRRLQMKELQGFAAIYDRQIIGVVLFQMHGKRLVLDNLFVDPRFRRFGIGTQVLKALCVLANAHHLELLFSFEGDGIHDGFYRFVASTHSFFIQRQKGGTALLTVEDVKQLCSKYPRNHHEHLCFFDLPHMVREEFLSHLKGSYPEIAWELHADHQDYRADLCCCIVANGHVQAACFMKEHAGELELKLLYSRPGKGPLAAKALLQTIGEIGQRDPMPVRFAPMGEAAMKIMEGLCPSWHKEKQIYTAYYTGTVK